MKTKKITPVWWCIFLITPVMFFAQTATNQSINNTFYGQNAGLNNSASFSCGFGVNALMNNSGNSNTGFGIYSLMQSKGGFNTAYGTSAMKSNDRGSLNAAFGSRTLENNSSGSFNVAIGHRSMGDLSEPGNMNTAIGYSALKINAGDGNIALGYFSPRHLVAGNKNVFIGTETAANLQRGNGNVFLGKISVNPFPSSATQIGNDINKTIIFADGYGAQRLTISQLGYVGIGLGNNVLASNRLEVNGGVVVGKSFVSNASPMPGLTAPSNGMLIEGSVGIGTSTPGNKLEITQGTNGFSGLRFTNLTSNFLPSTTSTTRKFLTVNATGDVILENVGTSNVLQTSQNTVTSTVNGVSSNAPLVNSVETIFTENNQLTTIVNGVASTPITIPISVDTDAQSLTLTGNVLSISNGNAVTLPVDSDSNPTNELQTLTQNGNVVTLSNGGGSFTLPTDTDTDAQTLSLTGNVLSISNGNNVTLPQTMIQGGSNISVSGNGSAATPYLISSIDTSLYSANGSINQATTTGANRVVNLNSRNIWFNTSTSTVNGKIYIGNTTLYPTTTGNYRLYVEGGILTEKVKVALRNSNNWADYVFAKDYKLMPLKEVASFIEKNKHLPGVAAADQLAAEGLDLAAMQAKHMEKIEELTLYIIDQDQKIETQQATLNQQQKEIETLKTQVELLIQKMK